ncbi:MAG: type VI secretion system membrane subunit TssM [Comamonadaceae bacterium]|nr:MAG: type VI secretion system membrane subunit TssM [Comamonadaceae bacterium]
MNYLKKLFEILWSRAVLACVVLLLVALLVWFAGPLMAIDGLRPLESPAVRTVIIALLLVLGMLWLVDGPMSLVAVPAFCLLLWEAGPLLSFGDAHPLRPDATRALLIGLVMLVFMVYGLYRLWDALRTRENFRDRVLNFGKAPSGKDIDIAGAELSALATDFRTAVAQLKYLRSRGWLRIFEGNRYLYELPWFLVLGGPQSGKTTALLNSGLQYPLASHAGAMQASRPCHFLFTNEAVLIDTEGRFSSQDVKPAHDHAEWQGLLALLRKYRTRAPVNGVILAISAVDLLQRTDAERLRQAAQLRQRLADLRGELGIRFPVYVMVTKLDVLKGFGSYLATLTGESRTQAWGFTLPATLRRGQRSSGAAGMAAHREELSGTVSAELALLHRRLAAGLHMRLSEEFDVDRRNDLFALPQEFAGLGKPLSQMLDEVFLDSRFDHTQSHHSLRGVYFTSAAQTPADLPADPNVLLERLRRAHPPVGHSGAGDPQGQTADTVSEPPLAGAVVGAVARPPEWAGTVPTAGRQSFFLQDLMTRIVIPEVHLVRPNLKWEVRLRLLRLMGHTLVVVLALWLASSLALSFGHNQQYLASVSEHTRALEARVKGLFAHFNATDVPDVLGASRQLPAYTGLDPDHPPSTFRYGLYVVPHVQDAAAETYARVQEHLLLPAILARMERVLSQSVKESDAKKAYETLRVYKLLHDPAHYLQKDGASDVRDWVLRDWQTTGSAAVFGGRASMVGHVETLFSGHRAVQAATLPNEALVREVQEFLGANTSTQRVYERARAAMAPEAPPEFTLLRAVGPQSGTVFSRTNGLPLAKGVPGLYTYDGYHGLFNKRLPEFVGRALEDDSWVMGAQGRASPGPALPPTLPREVTGKLQDNPLLDDVRRQYLLDYAHYWEEFLDSIRVVGGNGATETGLGFDLAVLRQFAAPDSPLARLARAAARETTLSRPVTNPVVAGRSLLEKAGDEVDRRARDLGRGLQQGLVQEPGQSVGQGIGPGSEQGPGIRREENLEKSLVDDRFAALREVVTGQPDIGLLAGAAAGAPRPALEAVSGLVNEFYTLLVVADTALVAGSLPPAGVGVGVDAGSRLALEAGKLPAPFREVLSALAMSGGDKVTQGAADILRKQAQLQFDRLMGLMAMQVGDSCKRGIEGRYPFAAVAQNASIEDVTQVFAVGGAADEYFSKYLAPFVDTSVRPWRYKNPASANAMVGAESIANGATPAPAVTGPTLLGELLKLLARQGPSLDTFYRSQQIRELFFKEAGGKKMAWKMDLKILDLDPAITDLVIDIDGQGQRYIHGPVQVFTVNWPGPRGGATVEIIANPRLSGPTSSIQSTGPWALFRLVEAGRILPTATAGRVSVEYSFDGRKALLDIAAGSQPNPFNSDLLRGFRCPGTPA